MTRDVPRLDEARIKELSMLLVQDRLVVASALPEGMLSSVFMILGLGGLGDLDPEQIGNVVEDIAKAGHWAVNGYPTFMSCQVIHKDDWAVIVNNYEQATAALSTVLDGPK